MTCLINRNQSKLFIIYIISVVVLLNYVVIFNFNNITSNIDSLNFPHILAPQYHSEAFVIEQASHNKNKPDILYRTTNISGFIIVCTYLLVLNYKYAAYIYLHIYNLFLFLQRLLIPRQNSSRYKASFNIKYSVYFKLVA
ncbi:hypothetical protein HNR33_002728 [Brassicibacter mesophilus]